MGEGNGERETERRLLIYWVKSSGDGRERIDNKGLGGKTEKRERQQKCPRICLYLRGNPVGIGVIRVYIPGYFYSTVVSNS